MTPMRNCTGSPLPMAYDKVRGTKTSVQERREKKRQIRNSAANQVEKKFCCKFCGW